MPWSQPGSWAQRGPVPTWSQPLAPQPAEAGQAVLPGALGRTHPAPAASAQAPSTGQLFPHHSGVVASSLCSVWDLGHRAIYLALWSPFLGPLPSSLQEKPHFIYPNCLLPAPPTLCRGGASASQAARREEQMLRSLPALSLGRLWTSWDTALEAAPCHPAVLGSHFFGGSRQAGWAHLVLASLILFMLAFTIWSGVPGQAAAPGVGRAVLFEPVRLDSTVPRPTEDTVMRDCLCPMLFYLLNLI